MEYTMIGDPCDSGGANTRCDPTNGNRRPELVYELDPDESPSEGVVLAVSAVANRPPTTLEPLYRSVDTDALDRLFDRRGADAPTIDLVFEYEGYAVTVRGGDVIRVGE